MTPRTWNRYAAELTDTRQAGRLSSRARSTPCSSCGRPTTALSGLCTRGDCDELELQAVLEQRAALADGRSAYDPELDARELEADRVR